jgi:hypothetical protein
MAVDHAKWPRGRPSVRENVRVSTKGETYEQWLARTAPEKPVRTPNPRTWDRGVAVLLGVFFVGVLVESGPQGWIGLAIALVLAAESVVHARLPRTGSTWTDRAPRGGTLLVTLVLSGWLIWAAPGVVVVLPLLLLLLDVKDERSFLRFLWERLRVRADGPRSRKDPGPSVG